MPETTSESINLVPLSAAIGGASPSVLAQAQATPPESQKSPEDALAALKALAEIGSLLVALAYVAGWSYMAAYYTAFGLNPLELDYSVPATSAFAVHMLLIAGWRYALAGVFVFLGMGFFYNKLADGGRRLWAGLCVGLLLLGGAATGTWQGNHLAKQDILETSPRLPTVGFVSKTKISPDDFVAPGCLSQSTMDCKLLLHANGTYYFFEPLHSTPATYDPVQVLGNVNVFRVPDSEISDIHILPGYGTSKSPGINDGNAK